MNDPINDAKVRKAAALRVLESVIDFGPIREWAALHKDTLLRDLAGTDPQCHGRLASLQGALAGLSKWEDLERWVHQWASTHDKPA